MKQVPDTHRPARRPVIDRLLASRDALFADARPGLAAAHSLAELADEAVRVLAREADRSPDGPWAVIALGGYGSGRLLPGSDFDLLIASDAPAARVRPFAETVFYPLWDSGLPVGHQVRSRRQHLGACANDVATLSASLTGRVVAGDATFGDSLLGDVVRRARRGPKRVLAQLTARERRGSPFLLEPDLKEGAGGQRDLDELAWIAAVLSGDVAAGHAPLVSLGLLSPEESSLLDEASEAICTARWSLHLLRRRRRDVLVLDAAEELALDLEALTGAVADTWLTLNKVRRRVLGKRAPDALTMPEALFAALARGPRTLTWLEEEAWEGRLEPLVPGLRTLMTLRRPGLSHTLTVGAHCLSAAAWIAETGRHDDVADRYLSDLPDTRPLLTAALTHDAGKRVPGPGHAERGVTASREAATRLGIEEDADDIALLVREHLLLPEAAGRADASDEDAVLRIAERIPRSELVGPLYLLTVADTLATRADLWTPWRGAVVGELAMRLERALAPEVQGAGVGADAAATRRAALALLPPDAGDARAFIEGAPLRYLAATPAGAVAAHASLAAPLVGVRDQTAAAVAVGPGPAPAIWRVTVATRDRHGLFATLAGVLALSGLSILSAEALEGPRSVAIDVFTVESATLAPVDTSTWSGFDRMLRAALAERLELEVRLGVRRAHYPASRTDVPVVVSADTTGAFATAIHVEAADRVGLLHDLARVIADSGLDIRSATALTLDGAASDTFRVVDASGEPPRDAETIERAAGLLREAAGVSPPTSESGGSRPAR